LSGEYEGMLAWAVKGFSLWQKDGLGDVLKISEATNEYREESDIIGGFIEERCTVGQECRVSSTELLKAVQLWARDSGLRSIRRNEFLDYMKKGGFEKDRLTASGERGKIYWFGIGLKSEESEGSEETFGGYSNNHEHEKRPF
jgi:putative DNA primase/helicase